MESRTANLQKTVELLKPEKDVDEEYLDVAIESLGEAQEACDAITRKTGADRTYEVLKVAGIITILLPVYFAACLLLLLGVIMAVQCYDDQCRLQRGQN